MDCICCYTISSGKAGSRCRLRMQDHPPDQNLASRDLGIDVTVLCAADWSKLGQDVVFACAGLLCTVATACSDSWMAGALISHVLFEWTSAVTPVHACYAGHAQRLSQSCQCRPAKACCWRNHVGAIRSTPPKPTHLQCMSGLCDARCPHDCWQSLLVRRHAGRNDVP